MISGNGIGFSYDIDGGEALRSINIQVAKGEFVAILGRNGSGKSTLARHMNALLRLQTGALRVAGLDVRDEHTLWALRRRCGMVFQNPDSQFVSSLVEEDIAFGLENYGIPRAEIAEKVAAALRLVGMEGFEKRAPHTLSGGQKQRVALAGVLALEPELLILDEATAMLDPEGRREVLAVVQRLHRARRQTVLMITHYAEEAALAERVVVMDGGTICADGPAREVLADAETLRKAGLLAPLPTRVYEDLRRAGIALKTCPLTNEELVEELCRLSWKK